MIIVQKIAGLATVQDAGRVGYAAHAVPRGGALVRALHARANAAVQNDEDDAAVEIFGRLIVTAEHDVVVATERGDVHHLCAGESFVVEPDANARARYLAVANGVDAPCVLGSRATLAMCGIGALLRAGDRIVPRTRTESDARTERAERSALVERDEPNASAPFTSGAIHLVEGPDDVGAFEALLSRAWRVGSASNRAGTRLDGDPITRASDDTWPSSPMTIGAIELPAGGVPIVIGPDGPTTGGYPIVAVIASADLDRFHALPLGARVSFVRA